MTHWAKESAVKYDALEDSNNNKTKLDEYISKLWENWLTELELKKILSRYNAEKKSLIDGNKEQIKSVLLDVIVSKCYQELLITNWIWSSKKLNWKIDLSNTNVKFEDYGNLFSNRVIVSFDELLILKKLWINFREIGKLLQAKIDNKVTWIKVQEPVIITKEPVAKDIISPLQSVQQISVLKPEEAPKEIKLPEKIQEKPVAKPVTKTKKIVAEVKKSTKKTTVEINQKVCEKPNKPKIKKPSTHIKVPEIIQSPDIIAWDNAIVTGNNIRIRNKNWTFNWNENVNKSDKLILTWETVKMKKGLYYWIKMEDNTTWYIYSKCVKIEKNTKTEAQDNPKELLKNAKQALSSAIDSTKIFEKDSAKLEKELLESHKSVVEARKNAEKVSKDSNAKLEDINRVLEDLKTAQKNYEKIAKELATKAETARKKVEEKQQKIKSNFDEKIAFKIEACEKVVVAEYKVIWREQDNINMDSPGRKTWKDKDWNRYYYRETVYENDFELYKKDGKYILEMNGSGVFSDNKLIFDKIPTKEELNKKIDEMSKKYMAWDSREFELVSKI